MGLKHVILACAVSLRGYLRETVPIGKRKICQDPCTSSGTRGLKTATSDAIPIKKTSCGRAEISPKVAYRAGRDGIAWESWGSVPELGGQWCQFGLKSQSADGRVGRWAERCRLSNR